LLKADQAIEPSPLKIPFNLLSVFGASQLSPAVLVQNLASFSAAN